MSVEIRRSDPGWLKRLLRRYRNESVLAVGYPSSETGGIAYPDGTPVALVAATNNFGSVALGVPARPFMSDAADPAIAATSPIAEALIPALNAGRATVDDVLGEMGPFAEAAFKGKITQGPWQPNAQFTIDKKRSSVPLIDTGLLRNSLTHVVRKE